MITYIGALYVILPALMLLACALVPAWMPHADAVATQDASVRECADVCAHQAIRYAYAAHTAVMAGIDPTPMRRQAMRYYLMACEYRWHMVQRRQV